MTGVRPVFLMTDFGLKDPYVGLMKAVINETPPYQPIYDLTHHVPPQDETAAAFLYEYVIDYLPETALLVLVVDPGVGTERDIIMAELKGDKTVLAPDTGIIEGVSWENAYKVTNTDLALNSISNTFHGRDWFAPVARFISRDGDVEEVGPPLKRKEKGSLIPEAIVENNSIEGEIVYIDHFGNLITNIQSSQLPDDKECEFHVAGKVIAGLSKNYGDKNELIAVKGSYNRLEISVSHGSAGETMDVMPGASITVIFK